MVVVVVVFKGSDVVVRFDDVRFVVDGVVMFDVTLLLLLGDDVVTLESVFVGVVSLLLVFDCGAVVVIVSFVDETFQTNENKIEIHLKRRKFRGFKCPGNFKNHRPAKLNSREIKFF